MSNVFKINSSVITYFYSGLKKKLSVLYKKKRPVLCIILVIFRIISTFKLEVAKCHLFTIFLQKCFLAKGR